MHFKCRWFFVSLNSSNLECESYPLELVRAEEKGLYVYWARPKMYPRIFLSHYTYIKYVKTRTVLLKTNRGIIKTFLISIEIH